MLSMKRLQSLAQLMEIKQDDFRLKRGALRSLHKVVHFRVMDHFSSVLSSYTDFTRI